MAEKIENSIVDDSGVIYSDNVKNLPAVGLLPYSCYIDEKTILTENGELLQIIKIPSFMEVKSEIESHKLRDDLNEAFKENSKNKNLNFWFQMVRKKADLIPKNQKYKNYAAGHFMAKWNQFYNWKDQYTNEIYITVVIAPVENVKSKVFELIKGLYMGFIKKSKLRELQKMQAELEACVNGFVERIKKYEPTILKIVKKSDGIYYSEHLSFFNLILNNEDIDVKLPINSLSESLITKKIFYELSSIIVATRQKQCHYAIISLKYCNKLLLSQLDKIIQLNQEMVFTQSVSFVNTRNMREDLEDKIKKVSVNDDLTILNLCGYTSILSAMNNNAYGNCASQVLIQIRGGTKDELEANVKKFLRVTKNIGLVMVREEMFMPTLFWGQLPANFNFIKRVHVTTQDNVCAYASLYNFPIGKISNNHWGDCLGVIKSTLETPYFLPLHVEKNGNIIIIGPKSFRKTKYLNFLILMALKQCEIVYYLDCTNRSNIFVNSIGGHYYFITKREAKNRLVLNPFSLEKTPENIDFVVSWLKNIVFFDALGMVQIDETSSEMEQAWSKLEKILRQNINSIETMSDVLKICERERLELIENVLGKWCDPDKYGMIFNHKEDIFNAKSENIMGLNLSSIVNNEILKIAIIDYVLYKIIKIVDGKNTILAIDESWILFDNPVIGAKFTEILQKLYEKNVALLTTSSGSNSYETSNIKFSIKNLFATKILLPNLKTTVYQKKVFSVSEEEAKVISVMQEERGSFLLKSGKNILISSFDFSFLEPEETTILEGNNIAVNIMKKAKEVINSEIVESWLPAFFLMTREYDKKALEAKMKEREQRQIQWEEAKQDSNSNSAILKAE
jgi:type IV secretion system protein VirB4